MMLEIMKPTQVVRAPSEVTSSSSGVERARVGFDNPPAAAAAAAAAAPARHHSRRRRLS